MRPETAAIYRYYLYIPARQTRPLYAAKGSYIQTGTLLRPPHGHAPPHAHACLMATAAAAHVGVSTGGAGRRAVAAATHAVGCAGGQ
eukprot:3563473-Pleurochrysis_carterae.AAC.1